MLDVIKSYLVSLGFKVDTSSYDQAIATMGKAEKSVAKFAGTAISQYAAAGAAVTTFVTGTSIGIAKFIGGIAKADLENQKFARQMWTTEENARSLKSSLDAMGASLQDLYLSPELAQNFLRLRQQAGQMRPPDELKDQLRQIRAIQFEFQRLKLEATYALQWIGYYAMKYLAEPIRKAKETLKGVNDTLIKTMPHWTKQIGQVVSWFVRLGLAAGRAGETIVKLFRSLPKELQVAGSAFLGFFALLKMGPVGWIIAGLTALLLLLDDFYTYQSGGESQFSDLWKWFEKLKTDLAGNTEVMDYLKGLSDNLESVHKWLDQLWKDIKANGILKSLGEDVKDLTLSFADLISSIGSVINELAKLAGYSGFGELLNKNIIDYLKRLDLFLQGIAEEIEALSKLLKWDIKGYFEQDQKAMHKLLESIFKSDPVARFRPKSALEDDEKSIDNPKPGYAEGGWITRRTEAVLGEGGDNEVVIPINQKPRSLNLWEQAGKALGAFHANPFMQQIAQPQIAYAYPRTYHTTNTFKQDNNFHVYGSEPNATARAVQRNMEGIRMRNIQGVTR